jgi:geranylgeranyl reductase family protein
MIHLRIEPRYDADVLVVGAGPAGASAAAYLARDGHKVLLVDRQRFPRDKVCGDFVGPAALQELDALGIGQVPAIRTGNVIREAGLFVDGRELIRHPIPEVASLPTFGRVVPRLVLDDAILSAARTSGVTMEDATAVGDHTVHASGVRADLNGPNGRRTVTVRALVGADGSSSTIVRTLRGHGSERADRILAVRAYYDGVDGPADRSDLYFTGDSFPGYCWLFPTGPTTANVGVGMLLETLPPTSEHIRDLLMRLVANDRALHARLRHATLVGKVVGWPLVTFNPRATLVGERVLLVGDAAGLINPLNGEGIQYALASGRWAAETLREALAANDLSRAALEPYGRRVRDELRYDMALARLIIQFISNRTLNPVWMEALAIITARARRDPAYATITGGVLAGLIPAREVLRPRVIVGTAQQAVSSVAMQTAFTVFRGPARVREAAMSMGRLAADVGREGARDPVATARWVSGLVGALTELGIQATLDMARPRDPSTTDADVPLAS